MKYVKILTLIVIAILCYENLFSQNTKVSDTDSFTEFNNLDFFNYVIDEYISIIETNYLVNDSIIIYVDLYCDLSSNFSLTLKATDRYSKIIEFEYSPFYKYNNHKDIYIVFARFQGYQKVESDFYHAFDAETVTDSTLTHIFYPITYEFAQDQGVINTLDSNSKVLKVEKFEVDYNLERIRTYVNGRSVNYFRNYKSKFKANSEKK